ncbi:GNAT family N-acetyltransferase [Sinisalibacter aestuarii]|uniref:N-acetyltransferase n=1 Tax=Sinisalibacter aestuarii TaxID=2949426 RepID=A0ABQ5LVC6_9RHOB|nr:GNAT family N-acetyltransferase [Sinisalibacter aestuarii]GKY88932.1 N-acetyltransferase [Sinisalibacter aestuarii]
MIEWREAVRADVPVIVDLLANDALGAQRESAALDPYFAAFDVVAAEPWNTLVVGTRAGEVVACYQLTLIHGLSIAAATRAQIEGVRVHAGLRGQGVGAGLLADAEARARAGGAVLMQLTSNAVRDDALRFYERHGYVASHVGFKKTLDE